MKQFIVFFFLFLLSTTSVVAIGISPPIINADYEEGTTYEFPVRIINNGRPDTTANVKVQGELAEYVTLSESRFQFKPEESFHEITVTATFPDYHELEVFGKQKISIRAEEGVPSGVGTFAVTTAVEGWFFIHIPLPGRYGVISTFTVSNTLENGAAPFTLSLLNRGTEYLDDTSVRVIISDYQGNILDTLSFSDIDIPIGEEYVLQDTLPTNEYDSSKYFARAEFYYDAEKVPVSKETAFFVGSTDISVIEYSKKLTPGKINRINLSLQSLWGSPLQNVRGVLSYEGNTQSLPVLDFKPFELKHTEAFFDLPEIENKTNVTLDLNLTIRLEEASIVKSIPLSFTLQDAKNARSEDPFVASTGAMIAVVLLIIIIIGLNIALHHRGHKKHTKKK